jgi:predicted AlkP superfamily phosphohydrolase/phosphomutase
METSPVVLVGLDAADLARIERLSASGATPNFARFLLDGARGRLRSLPTGLSATIWPKWFEGGQVGSRYFAKQWNPDRMCLEWVTATSGEPEPFWCDLDRRGLRVCIVDVPQAPLLPLKNGMALQGWQVHDLFDRWTVPSGLWQELARRHGAPPLGAEDYGPQTVGSLLALRKQLLAATDQGGDVACDLLSRDRFDLFVMVLGALHRGGHYLWDTSQVELRGTSRDEVELIEDALDEIYVAADRAVGRILERAPNGARVLLFALHGMQANGGWAERFQHIASAFAGSSVLPGRATVLQRLRQALPKTAVQRVVGSLPDGVQNRLLEFTSVRMHDWSRTPWFALPGDLAGFLRLNVKGRESRGILEPGGETRSVEDRLMEVFSRMTDLEGRPIVGDIERTDDIVPMTDPRRRTLPDLLLNWGALKASETAGLRLGDRELVRWPLGQPHDSGRSGNHAIKGWYSAMGPGLNARMDTTVQDIDGIVPLIYRWLGEKPPEAFTGEPLLLGRSSARS